MPQIYVFYQDNVDGNNNNSATGTDNAYHYQDWSGSQNITIEYTSPTWSKTGYTTYWYLNKAEVYEYKFNGWQYMKTVYRNAANESLPNDTYQSGSKITYYTWNAEQWNYFMIKYSVANTYTIKYNANGANGGSTGNSTATYGSSFTFATNGFTRTGHSFSKWHLYEDPSTYVGEYTSGGSYGTWNRTATNYTAYAIWTAIIYKVKYNVDTGTAVDASYSTVTYGGSYTLPPASTKTGYYHTLWQLKDANGNLVHGWAVGANFSPWPWDSDADFYPNWTAKTYTLAYSNAGTSTGGEPAGTKTFDQTYTLPTASRTGYSFDNWTGQGTLTNGASYKWNTEGNITWTANYTANTYTVNYHANGGTGSTSATTTSFNITKTPTIASNSFTAPTGRKFIRWSTSSTSRSGTNYIPGNTYPFTSDETSSVTLYAKWGATVTFNFNGGTVGTGTTPNSVTEETTYPVTLPSVTGFRKEGYTAIGWNTTTSATSALSSYSIANADQILYVIWQINQYNAVFDANGKGSGKTYIQNYGTSVSLPTLKAVGWVFGGWATTNNAATADVSTAFNMPENGRTLFAVWTENANKTVSFSELQRVWDGTEPAVGGTNPISISEYREQSGQTGTGSIITLSSHFKGKGPAPP